MPEESRRESGGRWLTAGGPHMAKIYAYLCFAASIGFSTAVLGGPGTAWWLPLVGAVVLVVPLYLLLRVGDRLIDGWWRRRTVPTRRTLGRLGYGALALFMAGAGIWQIAIAVTTDSRSPTFAPAHVLFGSVALAVAGFMAWMAVQRGRDGGEP